MLKDYVCTMPVLEIYNESVDTMVEFHTDAIIKVLGAVLLQQRPRQASFHLVAYYSHKFNAAQ